VFSSLRNVIGLPSLLRRWRNRPFSQGVRPVCLFCPHQK